jgi:succinate dehydrogenase / fumarate reductase cytochrome b subunit
VTETQSPSFLARNEFLIRRLHSASGLVPVGAYLVVHLLTNASVLESPGAFQRNVYAIHSLGSALWIVEWTFIFLPILFHAVVGVFITLGSVPNTATYPYKANIGYTIQRITGMMAFAFIFWHVFHMHGWFHFDTWLAHVAEPLGGAQFRPYNASSTAGEAIQRSWIVIGLYGIGTLACVYHLAYGIWTAGITWGAWITPAAQGRAGIACQLFGAVLALVAVGALWGMGTVDVKAARDVEDHMYEARTSSGEIDPDEHKRVHERNAAHDKERAAADGN